LIDFGSPQASLNPLSRPSGSDRGTAALTLGEPEAEALLADATKLDTADRS
jgi:hypothetical protein